MKTERSSVKTAGIDREQAQRGVRLLLEAIGHDPHCDDLAETWQRRVPATLETLSEGHRPAAKPAMRTFDAETDDLVIKMGIPVYSLCKHHLLPYHGSTHVAYRPNGAVAGLSKLTRYIRWQSRRLTMQAQLTTDIADGLADELDAEVVMVELSATHLCEAMRGSKLRQKPARGLRSRVRTADAWVETETETMTRATVGTPTETERQQFQNTINRETE